jgi:hypothetical protein
MVRGPVQVKITGSVDWDSFNRRQLAILDYVYSVLDQEGLEPKGVSSEVQHEQFLARHRLRDL